MLSSAIPALQILIAQHLAEIAALDRIGVGKPEPTRRPQDLSIRPDDRGGMHQAAEGGLEQVRPIEPVAEALDDRLDAQRLDLFQAHRMTQRRQPVGKAAIRREADDGREPQRRETGDRRR